MAKKSKNYYSQADAYRAYVKVVIPPSRKIQITDLEKLVPHLMDYITDKKEAWDIITKNYCVPLYYRNMCPMKCSECQVHLQEMVSLEDASNWAALLHWKARNERGKMMDQSITEKEEATELPVEVSGAGNIFASFMNIGAE